MNDLALEVVFDLKKIPALTVWGRLYSSHRQYLDSVGEVVLDGSACLARDVAKRITRGGRLHFELEWDGGMLDYGDITNSELSLMGLNGCVQGEQDAEAWLELFLADEAFRQARLYATEYDFWQNAQDPLEYSTEGRSCKGLPMKSNNLPPPLERMVIDTSRNPGRRVLRRGFIEAVGCPMWLGQAFWSIAGGSRDAVCAQEWLRCETLPDGVVQIRAAQAPFTTAEGEQGEIQERLRRTLYPSAAA